MRVHAGPLCLGQNRISRPSGIGTLGDPASDVIVQISAIRRSDAKNRSGSIFRLGRPAAGASKRSAGLESYRSTCSEMARASSTSIPRYCTVLSIFLWPSRSWRRAGCPSSCKYAPPSFSSSNACRSVWDLEVTFRVGSGRRQADRRMTCRAPFRTGRFLLGLAMRIADVQLRWVVN